MVTELWLNLELLQRLSLANEEKERLIRDIINIIERNEIIEGREESKIEYLKILN